MTARRQKQRQKEIWALFSQFMAKINSPRGASATSPSTPGPTPQTVQQLASQASPVLPSRTNRNIPVDGLNVGPMGDQETLQSMVLIDESNQTPSRIEALVNKLSVNQQRSTDRRILTGVS